MAAAALAEVAAATGNEHYGRRAEEIGEFLLDSMYAEGRLMRSWQGGRARHLAVASDHAWLIEACVRLSEWTGRSVWRERARVVAADLLDLFWDDEAGGFFSTGSDAETLVVRPKEFLDGAVPAANSIAVTALVRVNASGRRPEARRRRVADASSWPRPLLERHPTALADLVAALPMWRTPNEIVVTGGRGDLLAEVRRHWLPAAVVAWGEPDAGPLFEGRPARPAQAYVCEARACRTPASDVATLAEQLEALVA